MYSLLICLAVVLGSAPPAAEPDAADATAVPLVTFPVPLGTVFTRHEVPADGAERSNAAGDGKLIYSNTLGNIAVNSAMNFVVDDIATVAAPGCRVGRYEFPVTGKVNPAGIGGPYSVEFGLYSSCPGSCPTCNLLIPGTNGTVSFPDDLPRMVIFALPEPGIAIATNVWFGVRFNRTNAGILLGAPATTGMSCDFFDFPGFPCGGALGGFPDHPHASFNLKLFGASECTDAFVGYKNSKPSRAALQPGRQQVYHRRHHLGCPRLPDDRLRSDHQGDRVLRVRAAQRVRGKRDRGDGAPSLGQRRELRHSGPLQLRPPDRVAGRHLVRREGEQRLGQHHSHRTASLRGRDRGRFVHTESGGMHARQFARPHASRCGEPDHHLRRRAAGGRVLRYGVPAVRGWGRTGVFAFGAAVDLEDGRLIVGAPRTADRPGAVHIFYNVSGKWAHEATLTPSDGHDANSFGFSAILHGDLAFVGAGDGIGGAVYVFRRSGSNWVEQSKLTVADRNAILGWALRASGDTLLATAGYHIDWSAMPTEVYVFKRRGDDWIEEQRIQPEDIGTRPFGWGFGGAVAIEDSLFAIGSSGMDYPPYEGVGRVHLFQAPHTDCNGNDIADTCDIARSRSQDCNSNAVPDECDALPPADFDFDADVDLDDVAAMQRCWTGAGGVMGDRCCVRFELQGSDADVDSLDYAAMRPLITGP